jgi:serine/threonine-protein kinase RsbW
MAQEARLQLLSAYASIEVAEHVLGEVCSSATLDGEMTYWVGMALREALANAIKHGNKLSPDKRVHVHMLVRRGDELRLTVEDEGDGFDPRVVPDPTAPENLLSVSGRGLLYMRKFVDKVHFSAGERGGTRIELVKKWPRGGMHEDQGS